ncbi:ABC-type sugar transport system, permease component [Micromonospora echinaurantiaca]|uniref:ABC-type sugar transport system, permease component n=1 Tax=Micromonospora echinaurantiaca TaxID=47857 RepID=A0A1C5KAL1_9ACTN|nr:sugar ABC transporter permease [Micromonospora echinaurantiaca]SCG79778.1 ABC-type sugar transport system, permease component [Micromonospora echinaurantiaca]
MSATPTSASDPRAHPAPPLPPPAPPAPTGGVRIGRGAQVVTGLVLLVPGAVALLWSYVLPSVSTLAESFRRGRLPGGPSEPAGGDNYTQVIERGFLGDLGHALLLALVPLLLALLVAPLLAFAAERAGRVPRLVTRALLALPLAAYAPLAIGLARTLDRFEADRDAWTQAPTLTAVRSGALLVAGLVVAVGATAFLAALRRRPGGGRSVPAALAVGGVLGLTVVAVTVQSWSLQWPVLGGGRDERTGPMVRIVRESLSRLDFGVGAAGSVLLLALLAVLGVLAVGLLLVTRTRISFTGWRDRPAGAAPAERNLVALGALAVGLVAFLGVLGYVLAPWLRLLTADAPPLPSGVSTGRIQVNTWLPPLISAVVGVGLAALAGFAIGGLRPLGRASELLLLPFAPWLFVGDGPLAIAHFLRAEEADQLDTFVGLIPPGWLSIPALVVFTLFFRGQRERWETGGRFASTMLLPALPMLAGAGLLSWLVGAQSWLWPQLVVRDVQHAPAANLVLLRLAQSFGDPEAMRGFVAQVLPLPMLLLLLAAFLALQLGYLDRLVVSAGSKRG